MRLYVVAVSTALTLLAGCAASESSGSRGRSDSQDQPMTVEQALERDVGEVFELDAGLVMYPDQSIEVCDATNDSLPPTCDIPLMRLSGFDPAAAVGFKELEGVRRGQVHLKVEKTAPDELSVVRIIDVEEAGEVPPD